ncbi:hypothetical protein [Yersinia mollaretii]|nr:hypothetical protein [Yersinia mollaretii]QKJ01550.1 hypothetical protein HRD69_00135 [Yersinia mollaretii ATCC 43969]
MKVKCLATSLTAQQKAALGLMDNQDPQYPYTIGQIYTVLAMSSKVGVNAGTLLQLPKIPMDYIISVPLCIFDIVDGRPSSYWKIEKLSEYEISLWPEEFYREYFHDDLSDGDPEVVEIFKRVVDKLEKEFD